MLSCSDSEDGELFKRAAKMLLGGATLIGQPCPYCKGVRVMKNGLALCVSCGREPEERSIPTVDDVNCDGGSSGSSGDIAVTGNDRHNDNNTASNVNTPESRAIKILQNKLDLLSRELAAETDRKREIDILESMNAVMSTLERFKKRTGSADALPTR